MPRYGWEDWERLNAGLRDAGWEVEKYRAVHREYGKDGDAQEFFVKYVRRVKREPVASIYPAGWALGPSEEHP